MKQSKIYNKLVRDKIPDIITKNNQEGEYYSYPVDDFENELILKLQEESGEYLESKNPEELADILEIFLELLKFRKLTWGNIENIRLQKLEEKGGFSKRIFLVKVEKKNENNKCKDYESKYKE